MEFKVGDRVRHVDDEDGSFGEGEVVSSGRNKITVDWLNDSLDRKVPRDHLELAGEQATRTYYNPIRQEWKSIGVIGDSVSFHGEPEETTFVRSVHRILDGVADTVVSKNQAYGDSALNPVRIFSKADRMEQLFVRLDDKLSRVQRGHEYPGDDTIRDIIGYCTLILIARESE